MTVRSSAPVAASAAPVTSAGPLADRLRAFCARVLGVGVAHPDAEDCAQEALARQLATPMSQQGPGFVFGIARHVALDHLRRGARRREVPTPDDSQSDLGRAASEQANPEQQNLRAERQHQVRQALERLPENQRRVLCMFFLEHHSYDTIAAELGVPVGTVATWLARGKARLAASLPEDAR